MWRILAWWHARQIERDARAYLERYPEVVAELGYTKALDFIKTLERLGARKVRNLYDSGFEF